MKSCYQGRLLQKQGKIKEAYEKYENIIFSGFSTLNFVLSTMAVHIPQELRIRSRGTERHSASN